MSTLSAVHPDAKIGANVTISPFVSIAGDVVIGDGTWIGPNVTIMDGARIGKNCRIFPGAVISAIPQDLKFAGEITTAEIGDNTTIRDCATINRGTKSRGKTVIGSNCLIMTYVHVGHDCVIGNSVIVSNATQIAGEVEIDDFAIIGGSSAIHQFTKVGRHIMASGMTGIGKDIPPYTKVARNPMVYAGLNVVGLRRRGFGPEKIAEIHEIYRYLYQRGLNVSDAVKAIEANMPSTPERDEILDFIKSSKRGIVRNTVSRGSNSAAEDDM